MINMKAVKGNDGVCVGDEASFISNTTMRLQWKWTAEHSVSNSVSSTNVVLISNEMKLTTPPICLSLACC